MFVFVIETEIKEGVELISKMTVVSESPEAQAGDTFCISTKAWSFLFFPFSEYSGHVARKREVVANRMQTVKEISLGIYNNTCHFCLT